MDKGSHSVYSLNYHLILVVKYRRKVIDDEISDKLKDIFIEYGKLHEVELLEWEHDKDHIHALIKTTPKITLSKFIGEIVDIARNTKNEKRLNRKNRQKMSNWATRKLLHNLAYKAKSEGIMIEVIDESYTTKTCPSCGNHKKPKGRIYKCSCGYEFHRDLHGARNILLKGTRGKIEIYPSDNVPQNPVTFEYINS